MPIDRSTPMLSALDAMPLPAALATLEADVVAAIDRRSRDAAAARRTGLMSIGGALLLGLVGGSLAAGAAAPARSQGIVGDGLAPSTLLLGR